MSGRRRFDGSTVTVGRSQAVDEWMVTVGLFRAVDERMVTVGLVDDSMINDGGL